MNQTEPNRVVDREPVRPRLMEHLSLIFQTGFGEIKRKGAITRLNYEIKGLEKEKEKFVYSLGLLAWDAHVDHEEFAPILTNLKELQIEINRLETQFGEHDTQIRDIETSKTELTEKFNGELDQLEETIVPHRTNIETINAEKEDNKKQIEELRSKQDQLSQQVRQHQKNIQELDVAAAPDAPSRIDLEKGEIRNLFNEKCEIECTIPILLAKLEKLKIALSDETATISRLEGEKDAVKRSYEHRVRDYNSEIHQMEEKKKAVNRKKEAFRREMEPFLFELGKKVDSLRPEEQAFADCFGRMDDLNQQVEQRRKQITEAESLSRAMDRSAWLKFLLFSGAGIVVVFVVIWLLVR